jgi:hypothetical protein
MRVLSLIIVALFAMSGYGQTFDELQRKYGEPARVFQVSGSIWMVPVHNSSGVLCKIYLLPGRVGVEGISDQAFLNNDELNKTLEELVPRSNRGNRKSPFISSAVGGQSVWTTYYFENVRFFVPQRAPIIRGETIDRTEYSFSLTQEEINELNRADPPKKNEPDMNSRILFPFEMTVMAVIFERTDCRE